MRVKGRFFCFLSCCNSQVLFWNKGINKKARHVVKHEWQFVISILAFSLPDFLNLAEPLTDGTQTKLLYPYLVQRNPQVFCSVVFCLDL